MNEIREKQEVSTSQLEAQQQIDETMVYVEGDELNELIIAGNERMLYVEQLLETELKSSKEIATRKGLQRGKMKRQQEEQLVKTVVDQKEWVEHLASLLGQVVNHSELVAGSIGGISIVFLDGEWGRLDSVWQSTGSGHGCVKVCFPRHLKYIHVGSS